MPEINYFCRFQNRFTCLNFNRNRKLGQSTKYRVLKPEIGKMLSAFRSKTKWKMVLFFQAAFSSIMNIAQIVHFIVQITVRVIHNEHIRSLAYFASFNTREHRELFGFPFFFSANVQWINIHPYVGYNACVWIE